MNYMILLLVILLIIVMFCVIIEIVLVKSQQKKVVRLHSLINETSEYLEEFEKRCRMLYAVEEDIQTIKSNALEAVEDNNEVMNYTKENIYANMWNDKINNAKKLGIDVVSIISEEWEFGNDNNYSLLGNLFDNAAEACQRVIELDKKLAKLFVEIKKERNKDSENVKWSVLVKNTKRQNEHPIECEFESMKSDKESHGYGTEIVKKIVDEQKGSICYQDEGEMFSVHVWVEC